MLTIKSKLKSILVIPKSGNNGRSLVLPPIGSAQVHALTDEIKSAERSGLISVGASPRKREIRIESALPDKGPTLAVSAQKAKSGEQKVKEKPTSPEDDLTAQVVALEAEGNTQKKIGEKLGLTKGEVYSVLRKYRAAKARVEN